MKECGKSGCTDKHIKGINCSVKNCVYHNGDCYCTAEHINVAPTDATSSNETSCATFKSQQCGC